MKHPIMKCTRWQSPLLSRLICVSAAMLFFVLSAQAQTDVILPPIGGNGGNHFNARCPQGQLLAGVELRTGDDVDAIRPLCVTAHGPAEVGPPVPGGIWFGGNGGSPRQLVCPRDAPIVTNMSVRAQGVDTVVVDRFILECGTAATTQRKYDQSYPSHVGFEEHDLNYAYTHPGQSFLGLGSRPDKVPETYGYQRCADYGLVAVGINGRSGVWLDAVGLICGSPTLTPKAAPPEPVKAIGRVKLPPTGAPPRPICEVAREARARNSPAAPGLEAQCRAYLAAKGAAIAEADSIVAAARTAEPDVLYRQGFDIATGIFGDPALGAQGNTATGPGSLGIRDSLSAAGQSGFNASVTLHLSRNYKRASGEVTSIDNFGKRNAALDKAYAELQPTNSVRVQVRYKKEYGYKYDSGVFAGSGPSSCDAFYVSAQPDASVRLEHPYSTHKIDKMRESEGFYVCDFLITDLPFNAPITVGVDLVDKRSLPFETWKGGSQAQPPPGQQRAIIIVGGRASRERRAQDGTVTLTQTQPRATQVFEMVYAAQPLIPPNQRVPQTKPPVPPR